MGAHLWVISGERSGFNRPLRSRMSTGLWMEMEKPGPPVLWTFFVLWSDETGGSRPSSDHLSAAGGDLRDSLQVRMRMRPTGGIH